MSKRIPHTITSFDGPIGEEIARNQLIRPSAFSVPNLRAAQAKSLLIESLLEQLCSFIEKDEVKQKKLFHYICKHLTELKFLTPSFLGDETCSTRTKFHSVIKNFIITSTRLCDGIGQPANALVPMNTSLGPDVLQFSSLLNGEIIFHNFRYQADFEEVGAIAVGGFGAVFKAWKKVDQHYYAVKKIPFNFVEDPLLQKVLREVTVLAQNSHPNLVNYKTAWIEAPSENDPVFDVLDLSSDSDDTKDDETRQSQKYVQGMNVAVNERFEEDDNTEFTSDEDYFSSYSRKILTCHDKCQITEVTQDDLDWEASARIISKSISYRRSFSTEVAIGNGFCPQVVTADDETCSNKSSSDPSQQIVARPVCRRSSSTDMPLVIGRKGSRSHKDRRKGVLYVQMELCQQNLKDWLDKRLKDKKEINVEEALTILRQILKGVEYLHSKGIIHRDLKPQNILFVDCTTATVKLGDFGLATLCCHQEEGCTLDQNIHPCFKHTQGVGTIPYAAPEQRAGKKYGPKADMYSIGVILLELLHPFQTSHELCKCFEEKCILPSSLQQNHYNAAKMISLLTENNPERRPSATDILNSELFLSKSQIIENLKKQLDEKDRIIAEKDREIINLQSRLNNLSTLL